jgi:hypothetical protein
VVILKNITKKAKIIIFYFILAVSSIELICVQLYTNYNTQFNVFHATSKEVEEVVNFQEFCNENISSDIFLILKTKSNVVYDASQWFHITEKPHHSFLENIDMLVSANNIT